MIVIQEGVWRADAIACVDICDETIQVLPYGCADFIDYDYDSAEEATAAFKEIVLKWENELKAGLLHAN